MTEQDDLRAILSATPPPEAETAKRRADLSAALTAFEAAENSETPQETAPEARPKDRQLGLTPLWRWIVNLKLPTTRTLMMSGASMAVLAVAVTATLNQPDWRIFDDAEPTTNSVDGALSEEATAPRILRAAPEVADSAAPSNATAASPGPGMSVFAIKIDHQPELSKDLQPGDRVDILLTRTVDGQKITQVFHESVEILEILRGTEADGADGTVANLHLSPTDVQRLTIAGTMGTFYLIRAAIEAEITVAESDIPTSLDPGAMLLPSHESERTEPRVQPAQLASASEARRARTRGLVARSAAPPVEQPQLGYSDQGRDRFEEVDPNPIKLTVEEPVSTFSIDVDTASYSFMRSALQNGVLPQKDAVRIEELINYFPYDYAGPETREEPFATHVSVMPTPWNAETKLLRIGIKGYELMAEEKPRSNLVFLLDTSGSMNAPNKLPLLKNSFRMLVDSLDPEDTVSIVVYAGSAGTVLEPTPVREKAKILASLDRLSAGGSTAGGEGIRQAYQLAEANFDSDGVNRVILATDGDFNVGISNPEELKGFVERKRASGIYLSVLGFGRGNYNDQLMQVLAQNGNGQAAYIDTLNEARKVLVEEASATLFPIAKDVKIQVEFNPATVAEYRLIGYETRLLRREDFNNDKIDAGEIGAGHRVTALYEIAPNGGGQVDGLRYQTATEAAGPKDEYAFVKIRYKQPEAATSQLITRPVTLSVEGAPDTEAAFAAAVAGFGQLLRGGRHTGELTYDDIIALANEAKGADPYGYRAEFVSLVRLAKSAAALEAQRP